MLEAPLRQYPEPAYASRDEKLESSPLVLCVDDEPHVLDALARVLRSYSCRVHGVTNGEEALALLASYPVDVIICDEKMPGMTGTEALRR